MQPVLFFIDSRWDLSGDMVRAAVVASTMPAGHAGPVWRRYKTCEAGIMLVTTAGMLVVLPATFEAASTSRWRTML
jgi:hypothetical protein